MPIDSAEKRPYYVLIETNSAPEGKTMNHEYGESCSAYGPAPHPDDVYKPTAADRQRWAAVKARMAHDRAKEKNA